MVLALIEFERIKRAFDVFPEWTQDADVGVHPIKGICENHRLCLPKKLFEYIQAGLPVVVTDLPEMRKIVSDYALAKSLEMVMLKIWRKKIDYVLTNKGKYRAAVSAAADDLNWDSEKHRLIDVYKSLLRF